MRNLIADLRRFASAIVQQARLFVLVLSVALLLWSSPSSLLQASVDDLAPQAAGDLDPTFGVGGKVVTDFSGGFDLARALVVQGDGKIVAAGLAFNATTNSDFALARYNTDGSLDGSFGSGGKVTTDFFGDTDEAHSIAIQSDGKLVVAGFASKSGLATRDFALARYSNNGTLDTSFGSGGKVTTDFLGDSDEANGIAIQRDGKIVVAGQARGINPFDFALARYNTDGSLDSSFGLGGMLITNFGNTAQAFAISLQSDGKIIAVGGRFNILTDYDFALARYNSDGSLDSSFGLGGKVSSVISSNEDVAFAVAPQNDGKIVVAGRGSSNGLVSDFALARYNTDGSLDGSFGPAGIVTTDFFGGRDEAGSVALQSDGRILGTGLAFDGTFFDFALARYNTDGSPDGGFGSGGKVTTNFYGRSSVAIAVALQADGKIVAAGGADGDFALARYNSFDVCLQDDSNPGNVVLINAQTGDYTFCCDGVAIASGPGTLTTRGGVGTIDHTKGNRRVHIQWDTSANSGAGAGTAYVQKLSNKTICQITDRNMSNNACQCSN